MSEQIQQEHSLIEGIGYAGGAFVTMGAVDLFAHLGPTGLMAAAVTSYVAGKHGPEMVAGVKEKYETLDPRTKHLIGKVTAWMRGGTDEEVETLMIESMAQPKQDEETQARRKSAQFNNGEYNWNDEDDEAIPSPVSTEGMFTLSEVLSSGFTPSLHKIYMGRYSHNNEPIYVEAKSLCHVALAGNTGGGKSSIMRLLMAQLCYARVSMLLLNPHYTRYDVENGEDWTPFEPYLHCDPMECRKYETIEYYLKYSAEVMLPKRLDKRAQSQPVGKPFFIVIDELPSIVRHIEKAPDYLRELLEEGRKVGIFLICAAQDFLVKTISPQSGGGSIRECYRTAYYVGGDPTTAKVMLDMPANQIPEDQLGKGPTMLRCSATKKGVRANVPYVDNESLYKMLGPSTFQRTLYRASVEEEFVQHVQPAQPTPQEQAPLAAKDMTVEQLLAVLAQLKTVEPVKENVPQQRTISEADQVKIDWAFQLWEDGNASVRKLESVSGWSNGETRRIIRLMKDQGLITDEN